MPNGKYGHQAVGLRIVITQRIGPVTVGIHQNGFETGCASGRHFIPEIRLDPEGGRIDPGDHVSLHILVPDETFDSRVFERQDAYRNRRVGVRPENPFRRPARQRYRRQRRPVEPEDQNPVALPRQDKHAAGALVDLSPVNVAVFVGTAPLRPDIVQEFPIPVEQFERGRFVAYDPGGQFAQREVDRIADLVQVADDHGIRTDHHPLGHAVGNGSRPAAASRKSRKRRNGEPTDDDASGMLRMKKRICHNLKFLGY